MIMIKRLIIIGLLFAIVIGGIVFFFTRDTNPTKESQLLSARLSTLVRLLEEGNTNSRSSELKTFVNEATVLILSDQTAYAASLKAIGVKAPDKATNAAEADSTTFQKLESAKITGQFDTVYPGILEQKLDTTASLVREVQSKTPDAGLKASLAKLYATISLLQDRLSKL